MRDLEALFSACCPVSRAADVLSLASSDASGLYGTPDLVARPRSVSEVAALLRVASRERIVVVPRGAGTGRVGGAVPERGGVVLDLMGMNRIVEIDDAEAIARVQPGVLLGDLQSEVERRGLFFPPDPASARECSIGGAVATSAGGLRGAKYGTMKHYVLGLEVVLASGEVIRTGARTRKSVTGYDMTSLFVGSEGTLGVVTEATLELIPLPESSRTLAAWYDDDASLRRGLDAALRVRALPRALEFVDGKALAAVAAHLGRPQYRRAGLLLVECDGSAAQASAEISLFGAALRACGGGVIEESADAEGAADLWEARRKVSPSVRAAWPHRFAEDVCVPRTKFLTMIADLHAIASAHGLEALGFGHAGDGNIHASILLPDGTEESKARGHRAVGDVFRRALELGGTLSAEHGIAMTKREFLPLELTPAHLAAQRAVKAALDPLGTLNPGKIFPGS